MTKLELRVQTVWL